MEMTATSPPTAIPWYEIHGTPLAEYGRQDVPAPIQFDDIKTRILNGVPCRLPCWEGVTVGETSVVEAAAILHENPQFSWVSAYSAPSLAIRQQQLEGILVYEMPVTMPDGSIAITKGDGYFDADDPDQTLVMLMVGMPEFTFGELVAAFGPPDYAGAYVDYPEPDLEYWSIGLIWLSYGFQVGQTNTAKFEIVDELNLEMVRIFPPTPDGWWLATGGDISEAVPWTGSRQLEDYFP